MRAAGNVDQATRNPTEANSTQRPPGVEGLAGANIRNPEPYISLQHRCTTLHETYNPLKSEHHSSKTLQQSNIVIL